MEESVPVEVRKARTKQLRMLSLKMQRQHYDRFVGTSKPVLFEESNEDGLRFGYTPEYVRVGIDAQAVEANQITPVQIHTVHAAGYASGTIANPTPA